MIRPDSVATFRTEPGYVQVEDLASEETFVMLNMGAPPFDRLAVTMSGGTTTPGRLACSQGALRSDFSGMMPAVSAQMWIPTAMVADVEPSRSLR